MSKKKLSLILITAIVAITTIIGIKVKNVNSDELEDGVQVYQDEELTYYINVYYDGKDVEGVQSSDTTKADINSGYIYVEDKLPEGLIFTGFIETSDGTIGAVNRSDGKSCPGYVVDGVDGLVYDEDTRTVKFTVKGIQAGCMLTVGVVTKTPILEDGVNRMDFYNTATATEGLVTVVSNTVHAWIGKTSTEEETMYSVVYQYEGTVPSNATPLPTTKEYLNDTTVGVEPAATAVGYTFSGWTTNDVTVSDGKFTMPAGTVTFTGSFTEIPSYSVSYQIDGIQPDGYVVPTTKTYYEGMMVTLDSLSEGDIINGYRFLGWESNDVTINTENSFSMPAKDVVITGSWEIMKYNVVYAFQGENLPPKADSLLPATESYEYGATVTLAPYPTAEGYRFLGWYKEDTFTMPAEDIIVYGEWAIEEGQFEPTITYEVVNPKTYYRPGDTIRYKATVTNTADFTITDVMVQEKNTKLVYVTETGYEVVSERIAKIESIPANSSVELYLEYTVGSSDSGRVKAEVELVGALGPGNYTLNLEKEYKASVTITIESNLNLCNTVSGGNNIKVFLFHITGDEYDSWVVLNKNACKKIYLAPGDYRILEVVPQDYTLENVYGDITVNNGTLTTGGKQGYEVTFNNKFEQKGFYHSFGRIINLIKQLDLPDSTEVEEVTSEDETANVIIGNSDSITLLAQLNSKKILKNYT